MHDHNNQLECRPRGILTRRLCRNRKYEDNELYRSNSFRFQRFERSGDDAMARGINKQVSDEIWTVHSLFTAKSAHLMNYKSDECRLNEPFTLNGKNPPYVCLLLICNNLLLWPH